MSRRPIGAACGIAAAYVKAGLFEALSTAGPALLGAAGLFGLLVAAGASLPAPR